MKVDYCVIGGGIAGLSVACELAAGASVLVLERERQLSMHATGRSAALYSEVIATGTALTLSRLSRPLLTAPPASADDAPVATPIGTPIGSLFTAGADDVAAMHALADARPGLEWIDGATARARVPILSADEAGLRAAMFEPGALRLDVAALVAAYRRCLTGRGGEVLTGVAIDAAAYAGDHWQLSRRDGGTLRATVVINAAGAWADEVALLFGARPLGLEPLRRTMIVVDLPDGLDASAWPAVGGFAGGYYFLPDGRRIMASAADEVASAPCDAQPTEYDIALAASRLEAATTLSPERLVGKWSGLRTFAPDRQPVIGYADDAPAFFWLAGQGGLGIQTAPAAARAAAALARNEALPSEYLAAGLAPAALAPARFAHAAAEH